jgi:hypothetical protein
MASLRFNRLFFFNGQELAEKLKQANVETATGLTFVDYRFDEDIIVRAVIDLFHRAFQKGRQLGCLEIRRCTGRVDEILHVASSLDMFDEMLLDGDSVLSQHGSLSISLAMQFNKHLTKLDLTCMQITRQQAAALGAGLITAKSQHFKLLYLENMTFADGAITELASGLKQNASLCMLSVYGCNLGDAELAEVVDAVESHPSLKALVLGGNQGQELTLVALGKVLTIALGVDSKNSILIAWARILGFCLVGSGCWHRLWKGTRF